ncbi:Uncharacterised protein [Mycobacteroides abscessus subsp. abscessus]|nr:Uncharacterised protein [Mycobacteroides abscessus subsp. abscessus]
MRRIGARSGCRHHVDERLTAYDDLSQRSAPMRVTRPVCHPDVAVDGRFDRYAGVTRRPRCGASRLRRCRRPGICGTRVGDRVAGRDSRGSPRGHRGRCAERVVNSGAGQDRWRCGCPRHSSRTAVRDRRRRRCGFDALTRRDTGSLRRRRPRRRRRCTRHECRRGDRGASEY